MLVQVGAVIQFILLSVPTGPDVVPAVIEGAASKEGFGAAWWHRAGLCWLVSPSIAGAVESAVRGAEEDVAASASEAGSAWGWLETISSQPLP